MTKQYQNKTSPQDFFQRLGNLPPEVGHFLASQELADNISALNKKFNLPDGLLSAIGGDLIVGALPLGELPAVLKDCLGGDFANLPAIEINFLGVALLPIEKELNLDVTGRLLQLGGRPSDFASYVEKFKNLINSQERAATDEAVEEYLTEAVSEENQQAIIDLFTNDLVDILKSTSDDLKEQLNANLFVLLDHDELLLQNLINILFANQAILTNKDFILGDKKVSATIANWLKDFIQQAGAEMPDNLTISRFVTNSPNIRSLDNNERDLLYKLLLLYRNLKFFPASLGNLPSDQWQIIPYQIKPMESKVGERPLAPPTVQPLNQPPVRSTPAPNFHFHPADEQEAAKFQPPSVAPAVSREELVDRIFKKANLDMTDEFLAKRFKNIILARLKDIRDVLETQDVLMKPVLAGGLGLDKNKADEIIKLIAQEVSQPAAPVIVKQPVVAALKPQAEKIILDVERELPPPLPVISSKPVTPPPPPRKIMPMSRPAPPLVSPKPKMEDVKVTRKLMGPIEELGGMNLLEFRRLSNDPKQAAGKLLNQINLLESESFAKKLAGIKAWRESDLYRLYLEIGRQSIQRNCLVREVIAEREKAGKPTLNLEEFEAVMDLNKSLRF